MMPHDWQQLGAMVGVLLAVGGLMLFMVRSALAGLFAERKAFEALERRVIAVEHRLAEGPTGEDMRELYRRMGAVETGVAGAASAIVGMGDGIRRVEHMLGLLVQHELQRGKNDEPG